MTDDELKDLLFEAGMTPAEIEACRPAFPEGKLIMNAIITIMTNRIAKVLIAKAMEAHL